MELPPLECAACHALNARHAAFCGNCGKTLRTQEKRRSRASWRDLAINASLGVLYLGITAGVGLAVWQVALPPPLVIDGRRLIEYTPGADHATLVCTRCKGTGADVQGDWKCPDCQGRGQVRVSVARRRILLLSAPYHLCARCNGTGWLPMAATPQVGPIVLGGFQLQTMKRCADCQGTGYAER